MQRVQQTSDEIDGVPPKWDFRVVKAIGQPATRTIRREALKRSRQIAHERSELDRFGPAAMNENHRVAPPRHKNVDLERRIIQSDKPRLSLYLIFNQCLSLRIPEPLRFRPFFERTHRGGLVAE